MPDGQNNRAAQVSMRKKRKEMEFGSRGLDLGEHVQERKPTGSLSLWHTSGRLNRSSVTIFGINLPAARE